MKTSDAEIIPQIWGPNEHRQVVSYRVYEHALHYEPFDKQPWLTLDVGNEAVNVVAFPPTGHLCALGCEHSLVLVIDTFLDHVPVTLQLTDPQFYSHKNGKTPGISNEKVAHKCVDLNWTPSADKIIALYDIKSRNDRWTQSHFFVYDVHSASLLHSFAFVEHFHAFDFLHRTDEFMANMDDGVICHVSLQDQSIASITLKDERLEISENRVSSTEFLTTLDRTVKRVINHTAKFAVHFGRFVLCSLDGKQLNKFNNQNEKLASQQLDAYDRNFNLRSISIDPEGTRVLCVPEKGLVLLLCADKLVPLATFGGDCSMYPGSVCWAAGTFVLSHSRNGHRTKHKVIFGVDHQSDYALRDRVYLWKGKNDGKLADEKWSNSPRNLRALVASRVASLVVGVDGRGICCVLRQRPISDFAGPMCPPGYTTIEECQRFYEREDELDIEVYDMKRSHNNTDATPVNEVDDIDVDSIIYPKVRKNLSPSQDIWSARRRILMRGWMPPEPEDVDVVGVDGNENNNGDFDGVITNAFYPGKHCQLIYQNCLSAKNTEVREDDGSASDAENMQDTHAILAPFVSIPQGILNGSFKVRQTRETKLADALQEMLQPERLNQKLEELKAEAERKRQRTKKTRELKQKRREEEKARRAMEDKEREMYTFEAQQLLFEPPVVEIPPELDIANCFPTVNIDPANPFSLL